MNPLDSKEASVVDEQVEPEGADSNKSEPQKNVLSEPSTDRAGSRRNLEPPRRMTPTTTIKQRAMSPRATPQNRIRVQKSQKLI